MNKIDGLVFRCVLSRHQQFHRADFPLRMLRQMAAVMMAHEAGISLLADPGRRTSGYRRLWPWLCRRLPGLDKNALRRWTRSRRRCRRISWHTRIKRAAFDFSCSWCRERSSRFPRNEHVFIFGLICRRLVVPGVTKGAIIARSGGSEPRIFGFAALGSPNQRRFEPARPLGILKKSLTCCSVLVR